MLVTTSPVSLAIANRAYDKVVAEKTGKGYQIMRQPAASPSLAATRPAAAISAPVPAYTTVADVRDSGVRCQLLNPISEAEALQFIQSPDWWAQEKHDGKRLTVKKTRSAVLSINRKGQTTGASEAILASVNRVPGDCVVDGEGGGGNLDRAPHRRRFKPTADGWQAAKILIQDQHRFADVREFTMAGGRCGNLCSARGAACRSDGRSRAQRRSPRWMDGGPPGGYSGLRIFGLALKQD